MRQAWKAFAAAVLAGISMLFSACGNPVTAEPSRPDAQPQSVTLWAAADAPLCAGLQSLTARFNELETDSPVALKLFPTEEAMLEALAEEKPDLLLCSDRGLSRLRESGSLRSLAFSAESSPRFFRAFAETVGETGTSFYPLGASVPVLLLRAASRSQLETCASLEKLCETASDYAQRRDAVFFAVEDFSLLFAAAMSQRGSVFYAQKELDARSEVYKEIYNLLAGAAFDGGLQPRAVSVPSELGKGRLVCGICELRALAGADTGELAALPVPPMSGCEALTPAQIWGIAVLTDEEDLSPTARFVSWLCTYDHASSEALKAGLLPAGDGNWGENGSDFDRDLYRLAGEIRLLLLPEDSGVFQYGADFNGQYRAALALLQ